METIRYDNRAWAEGSGEVGELPEKMRGVYCCKSTGNWKVHCGVGRGVYAGKGEEGRQRAIKARLAFNKEKARERDEKLFGKIVELGGNKK